MAPSRQLSLHPIPEGVRFYRCRVCGEAKYGESIPQSCPRCVARAVQGLSRKQFTALINAGDVAWCGVCSIHHIR